MNEFSRNETFSPFDPSAEGRPVISRRMVHWVHRRQARGGRACLTVLAIPAGKKGHPSVAGGTPDTHRLGHKYTNREAADLQTRWSIRNIDFGFDFPGGVAKE